MEVVRASALFQALARQHPGVELWPDEGFTEGGWSYFWIVSRWAPGNVRNLAYVRLQGAQFQCRTYDLAGDELWVASE
jgi:hypothetical protein